MSQDNNYSVDITMGNSVTTIFTGDWTPGADAYMRVYLQTVATGVLSDPLDQGIGADEYQLSFTDSGYSITLGTAPSSLYNVVRLRETTPDQINTFSTAKGWSGPVEEAAFDKLTALVQELKYNLSRAPQFPIGSSAVGTLPLPEDGKLLRWDGTSGTMENVEISDLGGGVTTAYSRTLLEAISAALARTILGLGTMAIQNANAVAITGGAFNGTVGVSTPSSGVFTSLQASSNVSLSTGANNIQLFTTSGDIDIQTHVSGSMSLLSASSLDAEGDDIFISANSGDCEIAATGDILLNPTGNVKFGTRTASSDVPVSGYITIKDSGGTTRKLAVIT